MFFLLLDISEDDKSIFAQINIPTQFSTYTNEEYDIKIEYPSNWQQFGDIERGDYETNIVIFAPIEEIKFKEFDSFKDYYKFEYRVNVMMDYSWLLPKLNLNFILDEYINSYSISEDGFKKFEVLDSNTNSKLGGKPAYKFVYQQKYKGDLLKYLEIGTIVNDNQVLHINFKSKAEDFDLLLPTFQHMIDSFKIGFIGNNTNTSGNNNDTSSSFNNLPSEEIFGDANNS